MLHEEWLGRLAVEEQGREGGRWREVSRERICRQLPAGLSQDSAHVGANGLALEPLAWQISQPRGKVARV